MIHLIKSLSLIMLFYLLGEITTDFFSVPIPGNVMGMVFLFLALQAKWVKSEHINIAAIPLISLLNLFFVPAGVGILAYEQLLIDNLFIIVTSSVISTLLVMWTAAKIFISIKKA